MAKKKAVTKSSVDEELDLIRKERDSILNFKINIKCKTKKQKELLQSILTKEIVICNSHAGVGKSIISLYAALQLLKDPTNDYNKIVCIYPPELDKPESLGFTPGSIEEKISVYTEADIATLERIFELSGRIDGKKIIQELISSGKLEFKPSTYLRGFTFNNSICILNESQNFTKDSFLKILTRIGENSKYIILGDSAQVDAYSIKSGKNIMGLQYAIEKLKDLPEFGIVEFGLEDILRNDVIIKILKKWNPEVYGDLDEEEISEKSKQERLDD